MLLHFPYIHLAHSNLEALDAPDATLSLVPVTTPARILSLSALFTAIPSVLTEAKTPFGDKRNVLI